MSTNAIPRHPALVLMLTVVWFVGLVIWSMLVAYVPGALHVVNDELWGRLIAKVLLPCLLPLFAASIQFARRKYISAMILSGIVILALFGLDLAAILHAGRH